MSVFIFLTIALMETGNIGYAMQWHPASQLCEMAKLQYEMAPKNGIRDVLHVECIELTVDPEHFNPFPQEQDTPL